MPKNFQIMQTSIISREKCLQIFAEMIEDKDEWNQIEQELTENNVCTLNTNGNRVSVSIGDGGAPLVANGVVVGVASRIVSSTYPNVFTKIYPHSKWIRTTMAEIL